MAKYKLYLLLGAVFGWLFAQSAYNRFRTKTEYRFVEMPEFTEGIVARPFPKVIDNHKRDRLEALGYTQFNQ